MMRAATFLRWYYPGQVRRVQGWVLVSAVAPLVAPQYSVPRKYTTNSTRDSIKAMKYGFSQLQQVLNFPWFHR